MSEGTVGRGGATLEGISPLGERALLLAWRDHGPPDRRWRLLVGEAEAPTPRAGLALGAEGGGLRLLMAGLPADGRRLVAPRLEALDGTGSLPIDVTGGAQLSIGRLARALEVPGRARLASWLLGSCPALVPVGGEADLALLCRDLLDALPPARHLANRRCRLSGNWTLVEAAPAMVGPRPEAFVLGSGRTMRGLVAPADPDAAKLGPYPLFLAFEDAGPGEPGVLVLIGKDGLACRRLTPARGPLAPARAWLATDTATDRSRAATLDLAALLDERTPGANSLTEELRLLVPPPIASAAAASATKPTSGTLDFLAASAGRLTVVATLRDPHRLVTALRLERLGDKIEIQRASWVTARIGSDDTVAGTAAVPPGYAHAPWRVSLVLRSGGALDLGEGPTLAPPGARLTMLLAAAGPLAGVPGAAALLGPAAREAAADRVADCRAGLVRRLGPSRARPPRASLALFLDGRDGAAARVIAMLAAESSRPAVDVILVAADPESATCASGEAEALAAKYGIPIRLVFPTSSVRPLDLSRLGAENAEAPVLLTLGAGVVPRVRGWAGTLLAALDRSPALALAGLPIADGPDATAGVGLAGPGPGPIPSSDASALRLAALARAGGLSPDWLDLGCRDLDLVTRLLGAGYRASVLPGPACVRLSASVGSRGGPADLAFALDAARPDARRPVAGRGRRIRPTSTLEELQVAA